MTTGGEAGHILKFAFPMLMGNLLQQAYNAADTVIVGRFIGADALAAVGATGSMTFLFYTLCLGIAAGTGIIISQHFGAGNRDKVKSAVFNSAVVTAVFGIIVSLISIFATRPILDKLMGVPDTLLDTSAGYMSITCGGTIVVAAYNWISSVMRSLGDSKTPLFFLGFACLLNIFLDIFFITVLKTGVTGAAYATVISQGLSAVASITYGFFKNSELRLKRQHMRIDMEMILKCLKTGIPISLQNGMIAISMASLQRVTNTFGETVMASYTVTMRIEQLVHQPFASLSVSIATFTGQNTGAGNRERVVNGYKIGMKIAFCVAAFLMVLFYITGKYIAGAFVGNEPEVIAMASRALKLNACFYAFLAVINVTRGFLNGSGDTSYAMINGLTEVICRVIFSIVLTGIPFIGHWGIWGTTCITWLITALVSFIRYKRGHWKNKSLI